VASRADLILLPAPGIASSIDRAHLHLADCTLGIVGAGAIGREVGRRVRAHEMRVLAVDPLAKSIPDVCEVWLPERLPELLAASDFGRDRRSAPLPRHTSCFAGASSSR